MTQRLRISDRHRRISWWVALVGAATLMAGVIEVVGQQAMRRGADHPQIEMARQVVTRLNAGADPTAVVGTGRVDLATSLDPWLTVTDEHAMPLASSGVLDNLPAIPPSRVFDWVLAHGEDRISWQPEVGVRSAVVVDHYQGGFVIAGRSLRIVDESESNLLLWVVVGWLAAMALIGGAFALQRRAAA